MKNLFTEISNLLSQGQSIVLATVIARSGSAPRASGARMLVRADGATLGTVGGGILEAKVEQAARQALQEHRSVVQDFAFSGQDAATMDAICGGQVQVLVEWVDAGDPAAAAVFGGLAAAIARRAQVWLATELPPASDRFAPAPSGRVAPGCVTEPPRADTSAGLPAAVGPYEDAPAGGPVGITRALVHRDGMVTGALPAGLDAETVLGMRRPELLAIARREIFVDPIDAGGTVYIFGAGHVSQGLAAFTTAVGFHTVVLDDRPEYACAARFPAAGEIIVLDSFAGALERLEIDAGSYLVIVTRGHQDDHTVLAQALHTPAGYIGMIGSRRKCRLIYNALLAEGFTQADIARVHGPIGLPIDAETPEEIGVSIVAEMIQVRAGNKSHS